jgi:hypothetical protein
MFSMQTALYLPAPDIEALIYGRIIVAVPKLSIRSGQRFALFPADSSAIPLPIEQYYRSNFLPIAKKAFNQFSSEKISIKAWAICEICKIIDDTTPLDILSQLTIWTPEGLKKILQRQQYIFLNFLRVYQLPLPQYQEISFDLNQKEKIGKFISLPNSFSSSNSTSALTDNLFTQRQKQLEILQPPEHPELEDLPAELEFLKATNPAAEQLQHDIQIFLGWSCESISQSLNTALAWINDIAALGKRSQQEDEGKSNYQAGTDFENVVRKSLELLGFTIDYSHKGGAGGLDLFCSKPYALVGECKAGKKIPNDTAVQLLNLGTLRLQSQDLFKKATKLIIGPGEATSQLADAAKVHGMAIINPETLEKLVKLQAFYPNSVDLFRLKEHLKPGQSDGEIEKYIDQVEHEIKLRSHIIQLVKKYLENTTFERASIDSLHGFIAGASIKIQPKELHEILIELSSPLTGYLGRIKGDDWRRDRFYFLRDLPVH